MNEEEIYDECKPNIDENKEEVQTPTTETYDEEEVLRVIEKQKAEAREFYSSSDFTQALNMYSLALTNAEKIKAKDQITVLNCNKGICFKQLKDTDKAIECFTKALENDDKYIKALINRMLLLNYKEDYIAALDGNIS